MLSWSTHHSNFIARQLRTLLMAKWLRQRRLRDMKCTGHDLEVMSLNPVRSNLGYVVLLSKLRLNKKYAKLCIQNTWSMFGIIVSLIVIVHLSSSSSHNIVIHHWCWRTLYFPFKSQSLHFVEILRALFQITFQEFPDMLNYHRYSVSAISKASQRSKRILCSLQRQ